MTSNDDTHYDAVVVLHGLGGMRVLMWPLVRRLRLAGYQVTNWPYASTFRKVDAHAELLVPVLRQLDESADIRKIHFVTHSMGGIVMRAALQRQPLAKVGRFVMIGPPNRGTPLARRFLWLPKWLFRPLPDLSDHPESFVNLLRPIQGMQTGIIAASHDLIVPTECTHLEGQCDHIVIHATHTYILFRRKTADQVLAFLRTGKFMRDAPVR